MQLFTVVLMIWSVGFAARAESPVRSLSGWVLTMPGVYMMTKQSTAGPCRPVASHPEDEIYRLVLRDVPSNNAKKVSAVIYFERLDLTQINAKGFPGVWVPFQDDNSRFPKFGEDLAPEGLLGLDLHGTEFDPAQGSLIAVDYLNYGVYQSRVIQQIVPNADLTEFSYLRVDKSSVPMFSATDSEMLCVFRKVQSK